MEVKEKSKKRELIKTIAIIFLTDRKSTRLNSSH